MTCDDFFAGVWTGSAWNVPGSPLDGDIQYSYAGRIGNAGDGVGWAAGGVAAATYSQQRPGLSWARFGPSWSSQPKAAVSPPVAEQTSFQVFSPPGSGIALFVFGDVLGQLWAKVYTGSAWVNTEGGAALEPMIDSTLGVPFGGYVR